MSAEDWHGMCHSEGMSGNCGVNCRALDECEVIDEIVENEIKALNPDYDFLLEYADVDSIVKSLDTTARFKYETLMRQTKKEIDEIDILHKVLST